MNNEESKKYIIEELYSSHKEYACIPNGIINSLDRLKKGPLDFHKFFDQNPITFEPNSTVSQQCFWLDVINILINNNYSIVEVINHIHPLFTGLNSISRDELVDRGLSDILIALIKTDNVLSVQPLSALSLNPNIKSSEGKIPLIEALNNSKEIAKILLRGADQNLLETEYTKAIKSGNLEKIRLMTEECAINLTKGKSPLEIAIESKKRDIIHYLFFNLPIERHIFKDENDVIIKLYKLDKDLLREFIADKVALNNANFDYYRNILYQNLHDQLEASYIASIDYAISSRRRQLQSSYVVYPLGPYNTFR